MPIVPTSAGLFAVLAQKNFEQIGAAIKEKYPDQNYPLAPGQWLLAIPSTTTSEISDNLGITGGETTVGSAIIIAFSSYFGSANPQIWEWMHSRLGV